MHRLIGAELSLYQIVLVCICFLKILSSLNENNNVQEKATLLLVVLYRWRAYVSSITSRQGHLAFVVLEFLFRHD